MTAYICPNCETQDTTQVTCPICDKHFCSECHDDNFRCCHICDNWVCLDCQTYHKVNGVRTCNKCFDRMIVTHDNYGVLTLEITKLIETLKEGWVNPHHCIGSVQGQLQTLKNRFGF